MNHTLCMGLKHGQEMIDQKGLLLLYIEQCRRNGLWSGLWTVSYARCTLLTMSHQVRCCFLSCTRTASLLIVTSMRLRHSSHRWKFRNRSSKLPTRQSKAIASWFCQYKFTGASTLCEIAISNNLLTKKQQKFLYIVHRRSKKDEEDTSAKNVQKIQESRVEKERSGREREVPIKATWSYLFRACC